MAANGACALSSAMRRAPKMCYFLNNLIAVTLCYFVPSLLQVPCLRFRSTGEYWDSGERGYPAVRLWRDSARSSGSAGRTRLCAISALSSARFENKTSFRLIFTPARGAQLCCCFLLKFPVLCDRSVVSCRTSATARRLNLTGLMIGESTYWGIWGEVGLTE